MSALNQGILLTVIGMGTVFLALWALAVLVRVIEGAVGRWERRGAAKAPEPVARPAVGDAAGAEAEDDLMAVIAAAVGAYLEAESAQVFLVPVTRPGRSQWALEGRVSALARREGF
ncbi:MAG: OadG family protein [Nitrospinota bacterium]